MSQSVISVENLSKSYQLGVISTGTFFGDLNRWWARQRGKPDPYQKIGEMDHGNRQGETLWALQDITFQVQQGEVLGIVGRNGAGKSTLLKILSQVTSPTSGEVKVKGRIASLLEVGTGFHPELTGRENIFMNGAILGMNRREITRKFDEIVDFSGVEKFIHTPVKRYSSGMYVRLAFAVAAHLEPDILIVDEVLAVGDAEFQKKCLGKMGEVAQGGRTVLFVSHNMNAIRRLVDRCIWFDRGKVIQDGESRDVIDAYLTSGSDQSGSYKFEDNPSLAAQISRISILNKDGIAFPVIDKSEEFELDIEFVIREPGFGKLDVVGIISLVDGTGVYCFELSDLMESGIKWSSGPYRLKIKYPTDILNSGKYVARMCIAVGHKAYHNHPNTGEGVSFEIIESDKTAAHRKRYTTDVSILSVQPSYNLEKDEQ